MIRLLTALMFSFVSIVALASGGNVSAGDVASNTNDILETITSIITVVLYVASLGVFVSATMKYRIHRQNPQQIPLSTPLTELVLAIILGGLPTVSKMTNGHLFNVTPQLIQSSASPHGPAGIAPIAPPVQQQYQQQQYQQPQYQPPQYTPPAYSAPPQ